MIFFLLFIVVLLYVFIIIFAFIMNQTTLQIKLYIGSVVAASERKLYLIAYNSLQQL